MPDVTPTRAAATPLGPDEPALMLMTSGTTGRPKGIVLSQAALLARIAHNLAAIPELPLPTLCILSVFFGHGLICNVLTPLLAGSTVYLWPGPDATELRDLGAWLDAHGIGFMSSVKIEKELGRPLKSDELGTIDSVRAIARLLAYGPAV